jgi:hypothetical protein
LLDVLLPLALVIPVIGVVFLIFLPFGRKPTEELLNAASVLGAIGWLQKTPGRQTPPRGLFFLVSWLPDENRNSAYDLAPPTFAMISSATLRGT